MSFRLVPLLALLGCAATTRAVPPAPPAVSETLPLPTVLVGHVEVLAEGDPDYARADLAAARKAAGAGGLAEGLVVRVTEDLPVYRLWSGPDARDGSGNTNRLGQWWGYEAPGGTLDGYRARYEICRSWNDLAWVATCTLRAGAVVAVGPGQSVSAEACGDPAEAYPANLVDWQIYVAKAWTRPTELDCPAETADYAADPADLARAK